MQPKRLSVKFFISDPADLELAPFMEIFQRWIQQQRVEGLLIDVADYKHVQNGPGIVLIGDEGDYGLDNSDGRPGLIYRRKRQIPASLPEALRECFRLAITACQEMERERAMKGRSFDYSRAQITLLDRLSTANNAEAFEAIQPELSAFVESLYDGSSVTVTQVASDPRQPLSVQVQVSDPVDRATLLERLGATQAIS